MCVVWVSWCAHKKSTVQIMTLLEEHRTIVVPIVARHNGREIETMGDAFRERLAVTSHPLWH